MDLLNGKRFELKLDEYKNATQPMEQNFMRVSLFKMIDDYADTKVKEVSSKQDVARSIFYEYDWVVIHDRNSLAIMNDKAKQGWRVVGFDEGRCCLEREKK